MSADLFDEIGEGSLVFKDTPSALPNKDFVLRFGRNNTGLSNSFSCYRNQFAGDTGYFSMTVFPSLEDSSLERPTV
ncbi:MAG: hypothetical protein ACLFQK_08040 [Fibrobacterota bacterium]